ncbi:MAG: nucleotidyltransferase substrate binding protein [Puniceicoccales bacterium]|jgi:nucleotidyltransferase substrate binding protein (TIGR01987 family)|nr:nucleotidyltransferase substrate binding protein [Puniceicoccales bacterium]
MNVSFLKNALETLGEALHALDQDPENLFIRDSVIQRFEYSYELSFKSLKRHLEFMSQSPEEIDRMSFNEIIRLANEKNLLSGDLEEWDVHRKARNSTSHTYNQDVANSVIQVARKFYGEALFLLSKISPRQ